MHQHLETAVEHLLATPDADVVICCATRQQANRVFDELGGALAIRAPRGAALVIRRGQLEVTCDAARVRVQLTGHPVAGAHPTLAVDLGASTAAYRDIRRALTKRHGHLLVAAVDH